MRCPRCGWNVGPEKGFMKDVTKAYPKAFKPWTPEDDQLLASCLQTNMNYIEMSQKLLRQPTAIQRRAEKLGMAAKEASPAPASTAKTPTEAFKEDEQKALGK